MTRETNPAAPRGLLRALSLIIGALTIAGLTGCSGDLSLGNTSDASLTQKTRPSVSIAPVQGVPQKMASNVNDRLAASLKEKGIQVVAANDAQYVVKASYSAFPEPKQGTKVSYTIDIIDKAGNKVRSLGGDDVVSPKRGGDSWSHVTDEAAQKVAVKSATDITAWIDNPNAPVPAAPTAAVASAVPAAPVKTAAHHAPTKTAAAEPQVQTASLASGVVTSPPPAAPARAAKSAAATKEVVAFVPPITGAPGDGKTALSEAMKRALAQQGVKLAAVPAAGHYKIQGQVEMGAPANNEQPITIRWLVFDPNGKQIDKTVVQNNKIAAGALDSAWGETADQAAGAAAAEVSKLLNKSTTGQAQQQTGGSAG